MAKLDTHNADACRRLLLQKGIDGVPLERFRGATLGGILELFAGIAESASALQVSSRFVAAPELAMVYERIAKVWTGAACGEFQAVHGTRRMEFHRLREPAIMSDPDKGLPFQLFQERFDRSACAMGFPSAFTKAIASVLNEMADNVFQHSELGRGNEFTGLAGYHVEPDYLALAVFDLGIGALSSLRHSVEWEELPDDVSALRSILMNGASRRLMQGQGEGFKLLYRSLLNHNARVRLRSGSAAFVVEQDKGLRQASPISSPPLPGLQLSLCVSLGRQTQEEIFSFDTFTSLSETEKSHDRR